LGRAAAAGLGGLLAVLLGAPRGGRADAHELDLVEHIFGATNVQAVAGAGGLTIGVSRDGDLTVLTWPSPSYYDQLSYVTSNGEDARALPRFGASEGMGAFAGLVYSTDGGATQAVDWLRDAGWTRVLGYASARSSVVEATFANAALGLTVTQTDFVDEIDDVWVRVLHVVRDPASPVTGAAALLYANLTPTLSRLPEIPLADWALEPRNDFAAVYDAAAGTVLHFHPADRAVVDGLTDLFMGTGPTDYGPIGVALGAAAPGTPVDDATADALVAALDADYAPGVYLALGTVPAPDGWEVGFDETDLCGPLGVLADNLGTLGDRYPDAEAGAAGAAAGLLRCTGVLQPGQAIYGDEGWTAAAPDALADAADDGDLAGARVAAGHVNEALRVPLAFAVGPGGDEARAAFYLAAGATAGAARGALEAVRAADPDALADVTRAAHEAWVGALALPDAAGVDPALVDFSARTLLNLRVGLDRATSALVASISRQPPYGEDWPRDGAFFDAALDVAGLTDLVTERMRFYALTQRDVPALPTPFIDTPGPGYPDDPTDATYPADGWEMNYYADGVVGGNIRFEIDNTALATWSMVAHAGYLADPVARMDYLAELFPTVRRAADLMTYWRDPDTYLPWKANEDDHAAFTQGLQGAATVFGALRAAAMAARALGEDASAAAWEYRAAEVRWAIDHELYVPGTGFVEEMVGGNPGSSPTGSSSWVAWPAKVFGPDGGGAYAALDPRVADQLSANLDAVLADAAGLTGGGAYPAKVSLAAALVHPDPAERDRALELAEAMVNDVADPETRYLGEVFVSVDDDGDGVTDRFDNRVATPHLWAATLVYLTVMAYEHPERFDLYEDVLPPAQIPEDVPPPGGAAGDGGTTDGGGSASDAGTFAVEGGGGGGCGCAVGRGGTPERAGSGLLLLSLLVIGTRAYPRGARGRRWI
jgi:hypothetical protein